MVLCGQCHRYTDTDTQTDTYRDTGADTQRDRHTDTLMQQTQTHKTQTQTQIHSGCDVSRQKIYGALTAGALDLNRAGVVTTLFFVSNLKILRSGKYTKGASQT